MASGLVYRDVEVRSWPERADVMVIDVGAAVVIGHYLLDGDFPASPLFDPLAPYTARAQAALEALESDQEYLRAYFAEDTATIKLREVMEPRSRWKGILAEHGIDAEFVEFARLEEAIASLEKLPIAELFELLCEWHDVVERHYPAGSSLADEESWVHRARPDACRHFHYLAGGSEEEAYRLFSDLVDVPLADFSLGMLIRWVYFHRAEFPTVKERFTLQAPPEARALPRIV